MGNYNQQKRGSEWRIWDLHIHTPGTKKNDQFTGANLDEKWQNYVASINNSTEEISVIGITDYFSIENYFKFKHLVAIGEITKSFDLIIPNIELRVLPVGGSGTPINLHCLFNPNIDAEIASRFLAKLNFNNSHSSYSAIKSELIRFGRDHTNNQNLDEETAYRKGVEQYVIGLDALWSIFKKDPALRENTIIVVSNKSTDGATAMIKHEDFFLNLNESQLDATRRSFYQFSDAIFSPNEKDRNYFIGKSMDDVKTVIRKCRTLKPCYHGCDAHSNDKIFKPDDNRYCWIKALPTFEGLKQSLYEPEDRVKIQAMKPDVKNERYLISEVEFIDSGLLFGNQKILLNENLNAIIGGKSSGKSLLLYSIANSIDPEQVQKTSKRLEFEGYEFDSTYDFKVKWKNGDEDLYSNLNSVEKLHKITYIPQLYINYLVEKNNKEELNSLIKNILLQDSEFKDFYEEKFELISDINSELERLINEYLKIRNNLIEVQNRSKEIGKSVNISKAIEKIESQILAGQKASNLSESEFKTYNELLANKSKMELESRRIGSMEATLSRVIGEVKLSKTNLLGKQDVLNDDYLKGQIDRILEELGEIPDELNGIKPSIERDFNLLLDNLDNEINKLQLKNKINEINIKLKQITEKLQPFLLKVAGQDELKKLTNLLGSEKKKLQSAIAFESQLKNLISEYHTIRKQTSNNLRKRVETYQEIENFVNETKRNIGSGIQLNCALIYKLENFALYNQVNKASISSEHYFHTLFINELVDYNLVPEFYGRFLRVQEDKLYYDDENYIPLKIRTSLEDILRGLIKDSFEIDYTVTYKGDNLLSMSPGKKGTVLLILFLQISSSEFPILIDQPEDNLDNRTIYELLCKMIKEKKRDRQIIIVSHNANLVVATDTENIIVANQQGQDEEVKDGRFRFEYVNGALEHSFSKDEGEDSVLQSQGIKEHVCDILEGGDEAFKQRERKYSFKK